MTKSGAERVCRRQLILLARVRIKLRVVLYYKESVTKKRAEL